MQSTFLLLFLAAVRGVVVDPSARPVEGAEVKCARQTILTDSRGRFEIPAAGSCEATVNRPGFETKRVTLSDGREAEIVLALSTLAERVVVSATRSPVSIEEAGVAADVFTVRDFEARQYPLLSDVLRDIPGLSVVKNGRNGGLTSIYARGGQSTSTLVLLDGVPLNEPGGAINYAHLVSSGLERMEVVRGPGSALFGAEASSAVIQLFTRRGDPEAGRPHGSISYERGSFSTDRWIAALNGGAFSRLDYSFTADQWRTTGEFPNDFYRNTTGSANAGFRFTENTRLRAIFRTYDADAGIPNQVAYGTIDFDAHESDRDSALGLRLDDARSSRFSQSVTFGYHRFRYNYMDERPDGPYDIAALIRTDTSPRPRVYLVRLVDPSIVNPDPGTTIVRRTVEFFPFPGFGVTERSNAEYQGILTHRGGALVAGYDFDHQEGDISLNDVSRRNHGVYFHEQFRFSPRIFVAAGARVENSSTFGSRFVPRASASFRLPKDVWLRLSGARGYLEPTLLQNFAQETFFVGNRDLRPEKTASYEAGLSREWLGGRARTDLSLFHNSFRDLIIFDFAQFPSSWRNVERAKARGIEAGGEVRILRSLAIRGAFTKLNSRVVESSAPASARTGLGQELLRRPRNSGYVSLSFAPRRWTFLAGARMVGERQDGDLFGVTRNPGYQHVYLSGSWSATRNVTPYIRVENLLNARYQEVLGYSNLSRAILGGVRIGW